MKLAEMSLDDKYTVEASQVFMTGTQALVRLPMLQHQRDIRNKINTACYISGYRGSPLGNFDKALWQAKSHLEHQNIHFHPAVNEDLAATALWGTQQSNLFGDGRYDGVYGIWYGKGPGVDRSIDVFKHANLAGTAPNGGVLVFAGDDHICASSTTAHQSEYDLRAAMIPILNPSGVQDILDLGMFGWALSRYSGLWVGFVCIAETLDTSAIISVDLERTFSVPPDNFRLPTDGLHIRWPDTPLDQESRLMDYKLDAARAFVRANKLDRVITDGPARRFGIVTAGKAYLDVRQALDDLGLSLDQAKRLGLSIYKPAMTWPLEPEGIIKFSSGLDEILVIEEKRGLIEGQLKEILYNLHNDQRPPVYGKKGPMGETLLRATDELNAELIIAAIAKRFGEAQGFEEIKSRATSIETKINALKQSEEATVIRIPYFCSGCPHNTSTKVPEGSRAQAGIGCHYMAQWMDRDTSTYTHMGGEGANWVGQAPFSKTKHVFQNIGDGTYFHSGSLAIRAAVASGANITYKILYNDAVAMTGGQPMDGPLSVPRVTSQLQSEGVGKIAVVTDDPLKYPIGTKFAKGVTVHHRDELDQVQRDIRTWKGVSAIVYDQMCATEKRRKRKRGKLEDPNLRVIINPDVCEGCGDCSSASNCLSVIPKPTDFGTKRQIDQSSCNKDYSCVNGFCPSFVMVTGGELKKRKPNEAGVKILSTLSEPTLPDCKTPYGIIITGVGGTGIVTLGALLGTAAHIEGKGSSVLDKAGLAQKYGAVISHVRISESPDQLHAVRIGTGGAHLLLGCDMVVAASSNARTRLTPGSSYAIINENETPTGDFTRNPDLSFPGKTLKNLISKCTGVNRSEFVNATRIATALTGDSIGSNLFLLGFAYQRGQVPLKAQSIEKAITLNGVSVEANHKAFRWGRVAAVDLELVTTHAGLKEPDTQNQQNDLNTLIDQRTNDLVNYQNQAYADRYRKFVEHVRLVENQRVPGFEALSHNVAESYHKLLAYKDEYEIARLYTDGRFTKQIRETFEGKVTLNFSLAPPLIAKKDTHNGHLKKRVYGPWMLNVLRIIAKLKFLRGTRLDIFGYTKDRRIERQLIQEYETTMHNILKDLTQNNHSLATEIASLPQNIRGFGHVKDSNIAAQKKLEKELMTYWKNPSQAASAAE